MQRPFSLAEARAAGVTPRALEGRQWIRLGRKLYCWRGWHDDPWEILAGWHRTSAPAITFGRRTAAWMHGLDFRLFDPVEVIAPTTTRVRTSFGRDVRRSDLTQEDVVMIRGLPATSLNRTLRDLCLCWPAVEALIAIDMSVRLGLTSAATVIRYAADGGPGARQLRKLAALAERAESPMETRTRWLFITSGLPRPQVQTDLYYRGQLIGRADLYYPEAGLAIEFDGGNHKERLVADNRRQNLIVSAGIMVLRFTSWDLATRPDTVVAQVRGALAARIGFGGFGSTPTLSVISKRGFGAKAP